MFNRNFKITNSLLLNNTNRNVIHPSLSSHPVEQREVGNNVEIIEINNSSDEYEEKIDPDSLTFAHAWSYIGRDLFTDEESYRINKAARERKRLKKEPANEGIDRPKMNQTYDRSPDHLYPSFYSLDRCYANDPDYKSRHSRPVNRFTIPNYLATSSTSSDDPNADIALTRCGDAASNRDYWNNPETCNEEIYFAQDHDTDKRTIWIYSYKNKRMLSDNDYMLTNIISNKDSSSCTSSTDELEFECEPSKESNVGRLATPIPYIPRLNLNLTSTLPTVTEVTEPIKQSSVNEIEINNAERTNSLRKASNSWPVHEKSLTNRSVSTEENSQGSRTVTSPKTKKYLEATRIHKKHTKSLGTKDFVYCEPEIKIISNRKDNDVDFFNKESDQGSAEKMYIDRSIDETVNLEMSNQLPSEKPRIKITSNSIKGAEITDPIQKLEGNWIGEDRTNDEPSILYDHDLPNDNSIDQSELNITHVKSESVANQFFIRNLPLLKPAEWNEYMPITESIPSLELTIDTDLESTKKSWFKKLFTCVKCLKKN